ncbi:hypothetical protein PFISCL1PPCAC_11354, partial [Pristionchus fissidentatus]
MDEWCLVGDHSLLRDLDALRQALLDHLGLGGILDYQCVESARRSDSELGVLLVLLNDHRFRILAPGLLEKILDASDLLRHFK